MEREGAAVTCDGRLFHRRAAVTGNALKPTVDRRVQYFYYFSSFLFPLFCFFFTSLFHISACLT